MKQQAQRRKVARYAYSRTPSRLVHGETVVVEAQSGTEIPMAETNLVLSVGSRLNIPQVPRKLKLLLRARIELRRVSDSVLQALTNRINYRVRAHLPVMPPVVPSKVAPYITFAVSAILRN